MPRGERPPKDGDLAFSPARADRAQRFFERCLVHTKARYARSPFILSSWQRDEIIRPLFGTLRWDSQLGEWVRLYTEADLELARKNGKSELLAGVALYLTVADGEYSAEVYGAAKDRDQAGAVFNVAAQMVRLSPILRKRLVVVDSRKTITDPKTNSFYRVIAADFDGNLGWNPNGFVLDEKIAQPDGKLWDALKRGQGTRSQPLMIGATTAGTDDNEWAKAEHDWSLRVLEDPTLASHRFVYIRNTADSVDPYDEKNWRHANPALGDGTADNPGFLSLATLRKEAKEARNNPRVENQFFQFRLNRWVSQATRWLPSYLWAENTGFVLPDELEGLECYGGLDLAATTDLAALCLFFPSEEAADADIDEDLPQDLRHRALWYFWTPEHQLDKLDAHLAGRYSVWAKQEKRITVTEGDVIDYDQIHATLEDVNATFGLVDLGVDLWNSTATINWCANNGITAFPIPQTYRALSPPSKELERMLRAHRFNHGGNPVAAWNAESIEVKKDPNENIRPVKPDRSKSGKRIDGIVALIMAIDGWMRADGRAESVYESQGVEVV